MVLISPSIDTCSAYALVAIGGEDKVLRVTRDEMVNNFCTSNSLRRQDVQQVRWLCADEEATRRARTSTAASPTFVTFMVALLKHGSATLLRKQGAVVSSARCRVTDYRVRKRV